MGNIPKESALYIFRPETSELCSECAFLKEIDKSRSGCAFFGPTFAIKPDMGSCGYWSHAHPKQFDIPWMGIFRPQELGYAENRNGFGCWRCEYFVMGKNDCKRVDRNSAGDTPGDINPRACCSLWERDGSRGSMGDKQLAKLLTLKPSVPGLRELAGAKKS